MAKYTSITKLPVSQRTINILFFQGVKNIKQLGELLSEGRTVVRLEVELKKLPISKKSVAALSKALLSLKKVKKQVPTNPAQTPI